ncbi:MAG: hypothetical protein EOO77_19195 [Oxalobacteraceae bacterium]|nr:MAG: hypothetical protein EOO77_19195 [Oxalobacteraceae bacterium]
MPVLHGLTELGYRPSIGTGLLAVFGLFAGSALSRLHAAGHHVEPILASQAKLQVRPILVYAVPVLAALYAVMVVLFGLFNRRQGSEYMAQLYADLPIYALAIVRVYEILLIPFALLCFFGVFASKNQQRLMMFALIASLPFTGLESSRSRLLLIAIYLLCFIKVSTFVRLFFKYARFYLAAIPVVGAFAFYSLERAKSYSSLNEFLLLEVYQRLDGLNLVTDLRDAGLINRTGQFDFAMFGPLISKIPFLEAARIAKMMGRTSTKQYYLQELLGRSQLDTANSMIADPLYFAGWAGVVIVFTVIGFAIARSDAFVGRGGFMVRKQPSAIAMAFVTSFAIIEIDLVAAVLTFIQNYILISLLMVVGTTRLATRHESTGWQPVTVSA